MYTTILCKNIESHAVTTYIQKRRTCKQISGKEGLVSKIVNFRKEGLASKIVFKIT